MNWLSSRSGVDGACALVSEHQHESQSCDSDGWIVWVHLGGFSGWIQWEQ